MSNIKFSIAIAYYNRKEQTIYTLNQFENLYSNKYNFEVIIIDDCSNLDNQLFDILSNYSFKIIYKLVDKENKIKNNYINPCVVYNEAFNLCNGEIIIIQNPECIHFTNIFEKLLKLDFNEYYYTIPVITSPSFDENINVNNFITDNVSREYIINYLENKNINSIYADSKGWYNHEIYRSDELRNLHFCSAISKINLNKLDGFDENCAKDLWYDDNEFRFRIQKFLKIQILVDQLAIHLYHLSGSSSHNDVNSIERNKNRYQNLIIKGYDNIISWK